VKTENVREERKETSRLHGRLIFTTTVFLSWIITVGSAGAQLADSPWPMFHRDLNHTGQSPYGGVQINNVKWTYDLGGMIRSSPAMSPDGTLYVASGEGKLYAIYPNGTLKWNYTTAGEIFKSSPAVAADGTVYVGSDDSKIYALYSNGTLKWSYTTAGMIRSSPAVASDGTIYIGSNDGKMYALYSNSSLKWSYDTGKYALSSPAVASDGTIYAGKASGPVYALYPNGTLKWSFNTTDGVVFSSPAIASDGTIYVGSDEYKIYALYSNGTLKWSYTTAGMIRSSPAVASDGTIYVGEDNGRIYALYSNGTLKWSYTTAGMIRSSPAVASNGTIYVGSDDGNVYAFYPNGTLKWNYTTGGPVRSSPAIGSDGTIYIGSNDGKLYAFGGPVWNGRTGRNYDTIQAAINNATAGDTIRVATGTYNENVDINVPINLVGAGAGVTVVNASSSADYVFNITANSVNISGFTVTGATGAWSAGIFLSASNYSRIENVNASNNYVGIYLDSYSSYTTVADSTASDNAKYGIALTLSDYNTLTNNTAEGNFAGVFLSSSSSNTIENNSLDNNGNGIILQSSSNNNTIAGNTLSGNSNSDFRSSTSSGNTLINNTFSSYPTTASFTYAGDINVSGMSSPPADPSDYSNISKYLRITNSTPAWVYLNISYGDSDVSNVTESTLRMWEYDGSSWSQVGGVNGVDTANNYVYANLTSFSIFAPMGQDTVPPRITIVSPQNATIPDSTPLLNATFNENVNYTWYNVDGGANSTLYGNTNNLTLNLSFLSDGPHNVTVYANDTWGNLDSSTVYFTVDTANPYRIELNYPDNNSAILSSSVNFNWTSYDGASSILYSNLTIDGSVDNSAAVQTDNGTFTSYTVNGLSDGSHS